MVDSHESRPTFFFDVDDDDDGVAASEDGFCRLARVKDDGEGDLFWSIFFFFCGGGLSPGTPSRRGSLFVVDP